MAKSAKTTSLAGTADIPVRRMDFEFDDSIPKYWFGGDPLRTMILTALSGTFPEGERMFMRAVRHFQPGVTDPELQKQVRAFIGQEAHHGKEHDSFNAMMGRKGLPMAEVESFVKMGIGREEKLFSPERMLAKTCALEHFTAMFAEMLLERPDLINDIDERLKPLWLWHAVEESEHKSVAYDVYQDQVGSYWIRSSEMFFTTILFTFFSAVHTRQLLKGDPEAGQDRQGLGKRLRGLWQHRDVLSSLGKHYLQYYRPDFHPTQKDSTFLRRMGLKKLQGFVGDRAAVPALQAQG